MATTIYPATNNAEAIELNISNANQFYTILQGGVDESIPTHEGNGQIPSVAKALSEAAAYKAPLQWETSGDATDILQPRAFNRNLYVPLEVPAPFGASPDSNFWRLVNPVNVDTSKDNLNATSDPTATDDEDSGYSKFSRWINTSSGEYWVCIDATAGSAEWVKASLTLNELGNAALKDTGTLGGQIPRNQDLPNSSAVGSDSSQIPTNDVLDSRGFAQSVDSVATLRASSFPANLERLYLSGYYGVGTPGGGELYADRADTTTPDNGGTVFVDAYGVRWKRIVEGFVPVTFYGAKGDGVQDDTPYIDAALKNHSLVLVPESSNPYMVDATYQGTPGASRDTGDRLRAFDLASDQIVRFAQGARFKVTPNDSVNYAVFQAWKTENAAIYGANLEGDRDDHTGTMGEAGMGIDMSGAINIRVEDCRIHDMWGDGIYIGDAEDPVGTPCEKVIVNKVDCYNNRRQGMSIIASKDCIVANSQFRLTNGASPESGVDVEPNNDQQENQNLTFYNCVFDNNTGPGLFFTGETAPTTKEIKVVQCVASNNEFAGFKVPNFFSGSDRLKDVVELHGCKAFNNLGPGFSVNGTWSASLYNCEAIGNNEQGFLLDSGSNSENADLTVIRGGKCIGNRLNGLRVTGGDDNTVDGMLYEGNRETSSASSTDTHARIDSGSRNAVKNCIFRQANGDAYGAVYTAATNTRIIGNDAENSGSNDAFVDGGTGTIERNNIDNSGSFVT